MLRSWAAFCERTPGVALGRSDVLARASPSREGVLGRGDDGQAALVEPRRRGAKDSGCACGADGVLERHAVVLSVWFDDAVR